MNENKEKLENCKKLIRFFLNQSEEYLQQAKFHCDMIYPHWQTIEQKIIETQKFIEAILEDSNKVD